MECSKCGGELDSTVTEGSAKWCKACRNKYQKDYLKTREMLSEQAAFTRGADAMRAKLLTEMSRQNPSGLVMISEVSHWISRTERPTFGAL
jgi:hypothetical protein